MSINLNWATPKKIAEDTGVSRGYVVKLLDTGEISYSKKSSSAKSGLMISVASFNSYWEKNKVI